MFSDDSSEVINRNGELVGKINTTVFPDITTDNNTVLRMYSSTDTGVTGPRIEFHTSDGTVVSPTAVTGDTTGTHLAEFRGLGYDGTSFIESGLVRVSVDLDQTVSTGVVPGRFVVITANNSGTLANILTFNSSGKMGIGTPRPDEKLHVNNGNAKIDGFVQFGSFTTVERNALTAAFGMVIYNTDTNVFEGYQNTGGTTPEWVALS